MCSFQVELIDYEDIKHYTGCVESCGAKKALRDLWKKKESAFDPDSAMSWKISVGKVDINDYVTVTAWLASSVLLFPHLLCSHFPRARSKHFITALLGREESFSSFFFGEREGLKLESILIFMQVCAHSASHGGFALSIRTFILR